MKKLNMQIKIFVDTSGSMNEMGKILLVDDDDQLRGSFYNLLSAEGYRVRAAASGEAPVT